MRSRHVKAALSGAGAVALLTACAEDPDPAPDTSAPDQAQETPEDTTGTDPEADEPTGDDPADETPDDTAPDPVVDTVADGFDQPWGLAFVPSGPQLLVTELGGTLSVVDAETGEVETIEGVPEVHAQGQGGLLDVEVDDDSDWVYLTYTGANDEGMTSTHLARGRLDLDQAQLEDVEVLFFAEPFEDPQQNHYGSRVVIGPDDHLYMSIGDREDKTFDETHNAQNMSRHLGTVIRLGLDGSVPDDNPFVDDPDALDEIYSYGHRNIQGMTVHPDTGEIWVSDHGEEDGDELEILEAGGNHGWPLAHTGCEYGTEIPIGDHPDDRDDIVSPVLSWECTSGGFPPAGMTFYTGDQFPQWEGDLFVAGLFTEDLARFTVDGDTVQEAERLAQGHGRIRDVVVGPHDGALYLAIDGEGVPLIRLVADDEGR